MRKQYDDNKITASDMTMTTSSMIIGVGILSMPRVLAGITHSSDGWISIAIAGLLASVMAFVLGKFAVHYTQETFYSYMSRLITKPLAALLTGSITIYFILYAAYEVRAIANISKTYLFERTPAEYIALIFLLVVSYAVAGSRIGLIRLNTLFLPIVMVISIIVLWLSNSIVIWSDLKPFAVTGFVPLLNGAKETGFSLLGFEVVLFYTAFMKKPSRAGMAVAVGVALPAVFYIAVYLVCIGIFTQPGLQEIGYPAIELAKEVKIPGEFFERMESIFFTIWIMTIFNTTSMAMDVAMHTGYSIVQKGKRIHWVIGLAPFIYFTGMLPKDVVQFAKLGSFISYAGYAIILLVILLYPLVKLKGRSS